MDKSRFVYAGIPGPGGGPWKFIEDTPESCSQAIDEGYEAFTTTSFNFEPEKGKAEPLRFGDLWLDIDSKKAPFLAVIAARMLITDCTHAYDGFDPAMLEYFMSGSKGVHIRIPAEMFGGENGHPFLPRIHCKMLNRHFSQASHNQRLAMLAPSEFIPDEDKDKTVGEFVDNSLYFMGKGHLLRAPNIKRPDGRYKVQVSVEEFFEQDIDYLLDLTRKPRIISIPLVSPIATGMTALFDDALADWQSLDPRPYNLQSISECQFMHHCRKNAATLSEPEWFMMLRVLAPLGEKGLELAQEYSRPYPGYSEQNTRSKFLHALYKGYPANCEEIQKFFQCNPRCKVRSPLELERKRQSDSVVVAESFSLKTDGLYYSSSRGMLEDDGFKVCSPLKILGRMRNTDSTGWARLVELVTPDGKANKLNIPMRDCVGRCDNVLALLCDNGLELTGGKMGKFVMDYLRLAATDKVFINVERLGWHGNRYVLPDEIFGEGGNEEINYTQENGLFNCAGDLAEWQEHVGRCCLGNTLLMLVTAFALTGPLLRPCEVEGGGLHLFGPSSTGKTTLALLAGSLCGGNADKGYIRQWNTTANAGEYTAVQHNDGLLVMDESGEATAEALYKLMYMLFNGQGKQRMRSDSTQRKAYHWLIQLLSTGEQTIDEKIEETGKLRAMAGQSVRVVNLPIDGGKGKNAYSSLNGFANEAALSEHLKKAAKRYYGTPLRAFLTALCGANSNELDANLAEIKEGIEKFAKGCCPDVSCGQVRRVAVKFGLIAAAGMFASKHDILPWTPEESSDAVAEWFKVWLDGRGGIGNLEIMKALERFKDFFARHGRSRFVEVDSLGESMRDLAGYRWEDKGEQMFFMNIPTFNDLAKGVNKHELLDHMKQQGWLLMNDKGNLVTTKWIKGHNVRGYGFILSAWDGEAGRGKSLSPEANVNMSFSDDF